MSKKDIAKILKRFAQCLAFDYPGFLKGGDGNSVTPQMDDLLAYSLAFPCLSFSAES
jgi:hypothetical protein